MGIVNATPDSFSDGGDYLQVESALAHALEMVEQGAGIIDIGGESTRPGAAAVTESEEIERTVPLIKALREVSDVLISIDTSKAAVAEAALAAGADIVNDVTGLLGDPEMTALCIRMGAGVCVMHMQGNPRTMQDCPAYDEDDVVGTVQAFFTERLESLTAMGMDREAICFDPGIGFGKSLQHNVALLKNLESLQQDRPLLLGVSRKSLLAAILSDDSMANRDVATAAMTALAYRQGIRLHRVHDVSLSQQSLQMAEALGA